MSRTSLTAPSRLRTALGLLLAASLLVGCKDNITCVFTTGCSGGGGGGFLGVSAALPEHGSWVLDSDPAVIGAFPLNQTVPPTAPVVVVFSESMDPDSLSGAIEIVPVFGSLLGPPVMNVEQTLIGNGRLLALFPADDLPAGQYLVQFSLLLQENPTDITGQELPAIPGAQIGGNFAVTDVPSSSPSLILAAPPDGATGESDISEIVAVFDRPMDETTVGDESFQVLIGGVEPPNDPPAQPLVRASAMATAGTVEETRVFIYRSADPFGTPFSLGADTEVEVTLSPDGHEILDEQGNALPTETFAFRTFVLASPLDAAILSQPSDAIGLANLTPGNPEELALQVDLAAAEERDFLDLFLFGTDPIASPARLVALRRSIELQGSTPIQTVALTRAQIDLQLSQNPADTRFADGLVAFAFRLRRATGATSVRVLDVNPDAAGIQDPLLDTVPPAILELFPSGGTAAPASDVRDIVLAGRASEALRSVQVSSGAGSNGVLPPALARSDGRFLSAPVVSGVLATGSMSFSAEGFDLALNRSAVVTGIYSQRGAVGPGGFSPGDPIDVEVFDAVTLAPLAGARVFIHADLGDGMNFPLESSGVTGVDGRVQLPSAGPPSIAALVTAELSAYDLFTFHGATSSRLSIPLVPTDEAPASVAGTATGDAFALGDALSALDRRVDDPRRPFELARSYRTGSCSTMESEVRCPYGPEAVVADRVGVQSFYAGEFGLAEASFQPGLLLQAFVFLGPLGPTASGLQEDTSFEIPFLLGDPAASTGSASIELGPVEFHGDFANGIDLAALEDDPDTTGAPWVTAEALVPGVAGPVAVGLGLAFDRGVGVWAIRSAIPGAASVSGELGGSGIIDPDLLLRCELRDQHGAVAGSRPRLSALPGLSNVIFATHVPVLVAPPPAGNTGGEGFEVIFTDAIPDVAGQPGLYRIELSDAAGRGWTLWRADPSGTADVLVHVPDLTGTGGTGLANGTLSCRIHAFAWSALNPQTFLWSDAERAHELVSRSVRSTFQKP